MRSVLVIRKSTGEFRLLRYEQRIRRPKFRWMPFSGVHDPVEYELERREAAPVSRTRRARVRTGFLLEVLDPRGFNAIDGSNDLSFQVFKPLERSRTPERARLRQYAVEHNANA
jgi:hypothetical protein